MKTLKITRNGVAVAVAILSALILVVAPVLAVFGVWSGDNRWYWTAGAALVLGGILYGIAQVTYDAEAHVDASKR